MTATLEELRVALKASYLSEGRSQDEKAYCLTEERSRRAVRGPIGRCRSYPIWRYKRSYAKLGVAWSSVLMRELRKFRRDTRLTAIVVDDLDDDGSVIRGEAHVRDALSQDHHADIAGQALTSSYAVTPRHTR
jgi:hypothetical protein